jgi:HD-GYP domain-containing protein (c-di-GMP phosphodiesterase class II)
VSYTIDVPRKGNNRIQISILERLDEVASAKTTEELLINLVNFLVEQTDASSGNVCIFVHNSTEYHNPIIYYSSKPKLNRETKDELLNFAYAIKKNKGNEILKNGVIASDADPYIDKLGLPIIVEDDVIGTIQLDCPDKRLINHLQYYVNRISGDIYKLIMLEASLAYTERLKALVDIIGQISSSLDVEQILRMILNYARRLLGTEAASLFLVDENTGELVLRAASEQDNNINAQPVRVPPGKGIIGKVVSSGDVVVVSDVELYESEHYSSVDQQSGFKTKSILAVPLIARTVNLGQGRGYSKERVIGGVEALNKITDNFNTEDSNLLQALGNQAATVLEVARLYQDANALFLDVLKALTAAIDAKDPYTRGHSQRVCDFSVEIARELDLTPETILRIQVGSLFHDIGKIGIPDRILLKPMHLTGDEYEIVKAHPIIGARILGEVRMLPHELISMAEQHHERLDGSGYPNGLKNGEITLAGRIAAVADVFDAMTSVRAYRDALPPEHAFDYLQSQINLKFDPVVVDALYSAFEKGRIIVQKQRADC